MESDNSCPVCFEPYVRGERPKHGKCNTDHGINSKCQHYICYDCCLSLGRIVQNEDRPVTCPMCREDWTAFVWETYMNETDDSDMED